MPTYVVSGSDDAATAYAKERGAELPAIRITAVDQLHDRTGRVWFADDWREALGDDPEAEEPRAATAFCAALWELPEAQDGSLAVEVRL